jgi:hypothetical protein
MAVPVLKNRRDRARLDHLAAKVAEHRSAAAAAADPEVRAYHEHAAKGYDLPLRMQTSFPIGVWLWGAAAICVMLPWALFAHDHHPVPGLIVSGAVLVGLVALKVERTRRRRTREGAGQLATRAEPDLE